MFLDTTFWNILEMISEQNRDKKLILRQQISWITR